MHTNDAHTHRFYLLMAHRKLVRFQSSGLVWLRNTSPKQTTLESNVSVMISVPFYCLKWLSYDRRYYTVPMDLDVKMKAVMIGATFLIVRPLI